MKYSIVLQNWKEKNESLDIRVSWCSAPACDITDISGVE